MRRQTTDRFRSQYIRWLRATGLTLGGILLVTASGDAGVLTASWTAPTTNTDGSALTDLAFYRVYYDTSDTPCLGTTYVEVATPDSSPPPDETVSVQLTELTTGWIYSVSVTAVDAHGNESTCSEIASAIAQDDSAITPAPPDAAPAPPDATTVAPDATTAAPDATTSTPRRFCPPGQARKGPC